MKMFASVYMGWTPILAIASNGTNRVHQVVGWEGGSGTIPATGVYLGSTGYVTNITDAVNLAGAAGGGGGVAIGDGVNSISTGTAVFANSNGITFGMNGSTITASHNALTNQSVQTQGTFNTTQLNNYQETSGMSNYQTTGNYLTTAQPVGAYLTTAMQSNAGSDFLSVSQSSLFQLTANNSLSLGTGYTTHTHEYQSTGNYLTTAQPVGAYLTTAMQSNAATISNIKVSAGTMSANRSDLSFNNGNGVTFGLETNGVITASVAAAGGAQTGVSGISAGTTQMTSGTLSIANGGGVSFGMNGNTLTATVATNYQSQGAYLTTARASNDGIGLNTALTANGVSMTANSSGLSLNFPAFLTTAQAPGAYLTTAAQSNHSHAFATTTTNGASIIVGTSNSNGITIGVPAYLTTAQAPGAYLTTARASNDAIGLNTALTANGVSVTANSSGLSLNFPAFLTTAMQSNSSSNFAGVGSAITNGTMTYGTGGLSLNLSNHLTTAMLSNAGSNFVAATAAFAGTNASGTIASNGISISVNPGGGGGAAIKGSGTYSQSTGTVEFANSNGITFGLSNNGTMTASHNGLTTAMASNAGSNFVAATAAFAGTNASGTIGSNGISVSVAAPGAAAENNWFGLLGANTAGNTTASGSTIGLSGINMTISGTNGSVMNLSVPGTSSISGTGLVSISANGSTISIGVPGTTMSNLYAWPYGQLSSSGMTNSQMSFRYFSIDDNLSFSRLDVPMNVSITSSGAANTANIVFTSGAAIYSANGSTLNPIVGHLGSTTYTFASNSANYSSIIGGRYASFPLATMLTPGEYWLGVHLSTTNNSSIGTATTQIANTISVFVGSFLTAQNFADFGKITNNASSGIVRMQGLVSISMSNTTQTFQQSQITASGAQGMRGNLLFQLRNF